ncbi:MATE family efflux transporter [Sandaracinobacteroides saxicola]|uniref:Multidrug-efflux transporter n=1 Tax=Sandaracinobacteroides saxicola TaxID=2759707 RepID=A0A7G5IHG3_9SPHN|nr:MATE family efflux transporter [Sandaracinobacteroides saxicola]QMW22805.1 MATE family efflux transporter [Sandaracinobacteroides saxicola]
MTSAHPSHPDSGEPDGSLGELLRLAGPIALSRLGIMGMGLTDAIVVGQYSATELGYHALGWSLTGPVLYGGIGLLIGVQVMTARLIGADRPQDTGAVLRRGLSYAFWLGVGFTLALLLIGDWALHHVGLEESLADGGGAALKVFALSITFYMLSDTLLFWFEAHGKPEKGTIAMWAANVVNLVLNLWMVPGHSPFGIDGAIASGWATFGARLSLLLFLLAFLISWDRSRPYGAYARAPRDPPAEREQRRIGYASGASFLIEGGSFSGLNILAGWLGTLVVAAWAVTLNVAGIVFMIPLGLAGATSVLVARGIGARSIVAVRRAFRLGLLVTAAVLVLLSLGVWFDPALIARAYGSDPALIALAAPALLLSCLFFLADGLQVVGANALRARGDVWWPTRMHFISYIVVMWPIAYGLAIPLGMGLNGIVWGVIIASLVSATALIWRFYALGERLPEKAGDVH